MAENLWTYLGREVNYCEFCGRKLEAKLYDLSIGPVYFVECSRYRRFWAFTDDRHSSFVVDQKWKAPILYDVTTGERLT